MGGGGLGVVSRRGSLSSVRWEIEKSVRAGCGGMRTHMGVGPYLEGCRVLFPIACGYAGGYGVWGELLLILGM